jgi:hypothetical protein
MWLGLILSQPVDLDHSQLHLSISQASPACISMMISFVCSVPIASAIRNLSAASLDAYATITLFHSPERTPCFADYKVEGLLVRAVTGARDISTIHQTNLQTGRASTREEGAAVDTPDYGLSIVDLSCCAYDDGRVVTCTARMAGTHLSNITQSGKLLLASHEQSGSSKWLKSAYCKCQPTLSALLQKTCAKTSQFRNAKHDRHQQPILQTISGAATVSSAATTCTYRTVCPVT